MLNSEQNLSITLSSIGDAVVTTDEHGIVTRLNPVAEELSGWSEKDAVGRHVNEIFIWVHSFSSLPKEIPILEVLSSGKPKSDSQDSVLISSDGRRINLSNNCAPIRDKSGKLIGTVLVFRDITEEVAAKAFLEKAKENAELANKAKDSFLATMSHEIRTPLSGLIGMMELLSQTVLTIDQRSMVQNALESGNSLLRILSDILDWSKIEEGKLELSLQPTSIQRLLSDVVKTYTHISSAKGLDLFFAVDPKIKNTHLMDPLRLSQILNNFVSNGIKFTAKGSITIKAELLKNLSYAQQIRFSVKDTGIGLSKEEQLRLFQNYSQATADTARLYGGTGLGLAICRRLSDLMDGTIEIESVKGIGSIFSITLSLPSIEIDMNDLNSLTVEDKSIEPLVDSLTNATRILAVDDHSVNLELLVRQIEMLGLRVDGAEDGEKALKLWNENKYDLIITDCHMPIKDGYALAREIRNIEQNRFHKRIPIIAYTANVLSEENEHCLSSGMDEVLIKPARIAILRQTLLKWLPNILNPISRDTSEIFIGVESPIDFTDLKSIITEKAGQISILKKFKLHHHNDLTNLIGEMKNENMTEAEHLAHRLKGSCKVVGARNLVNGYTNIETFLKENQIEQARKEIEKMNDDITKIESFIDGL